VTGYRRIAGGATLSTLGRQTFAALANRNYRSYFIGNAVSMTGTWMQIIAQSWLVLQLTGSATALGAVVALQTLPTLLFGPYGGVIADRMDKRRLLIASKAAMGGFALVLGLLTTTGTVQLWHVYALALGLGLATCVENPTRQAFVLEMVGPEHLHNAVSLNSVVMNAARAVGPAVAGIVIAVGGLGICYLINAASFVVVVAMLVRMDVAALQTSAPAPRRPGQLREGFGYVRANPRLAVPLLMMGLVGCLTYEFQVVLPIVASETFGGDSTTYGFLTAAMGAGAVVGGLFVAARGRTGIRSLTLTAAAFGVAMTAVALAPVLAVALAAMVLVGATSVAFMTSGNSTLQLEAAPHMRGRVMALFSVAFLGSTPIGGPIAGLVSQQFGGRAGLALGALACFVAAAMGALLLRRRTATAAPTTPASQPAPPTPTAA
jgi:MFS family permease